MEDQSFLSRLILYGFLVRASLTLLLHWTGLATRLAPDEETYGSVGWQLSMYWSGELLVVPEKIARHDMPQGYFYLNALLFTIFGRTEIPVKLLNAFLGAYSVWYVHSLAHSLYGPSVARRAATLFMFFPSLVLWSAVNIRDTCVLFCILLICWQTHLLLARYTNGTLVRIVVGLAVLSSLRDHLFYAVTAPPLIALLIGRRGNLARNILVAMVLSTAFVYLLEQGVIGERTQTRMSLEGLHEMRQKLATGGSAFAKDADISTPIGALTFLPLGLAYFFFSPFPWQITSPLKLMTVPEMLLVYYLTPSVLQGLRYTFKHRLREGLQIVLITGLLTITYSLGEGNVGTLYRHRAQAMPFLLLFACVGLELRRSPAATRGRSQAA